jgi:hypothetical protein
MFSHEPFIDLPFSFMEMSAYEGKKQGTGRIEAGPSADTRSVSMELECATFQPNSRYQQGGFEEH